MPAATLRIGLTAPLVKASPGLSGSRANVPARRGPVTTKAIAVRPYTVREGDSSYSIGSKRGMTTDELQVLNPQQNLSSIQAGNTILVPKTLSARDREILDGLGKGTRTYPVRKGESIDAIISKRGVSREDCQKLNPSLNLDKLSAGQQILIPSSKFTVREKEMLQGMGAVPPEFFGRTQGTIPGIVMLSGALLLAAYFGFKAVNKDE